MNMRLSWKELSSSVFCWKDHKAPLSPYGRRELDPFVKKGAQQSPPVGKGMPQDPVLEREAGSACCPPVFVPDPAVPNRIDACI